MCEKIVEPLLAWYAVNKRTLPWRQDCNPYHIWVSEIMLQQTRVDTVIPYYLRFLAALPTVEALADAPEDQLLKLWEGLGYYSRVRNMKKAANQIMKECGGKFPRTREGLLQLSGVGPYVSGAIGSIAFNQPFPAVDGNVLRVFARVRGDASDIALASTRKKTEQIVAQLMPPGRCGTFTQALMELGACVCLPNGAPRCESCPIRFCCRASAENRIVELPVKSSAKPRRIEEKTILVAQCGQHFALRRRPATGLLAGLWELPSLPGKRSTEQVMAEFRANLTLPPEPLGAAKHIFSHIEWHMTGFHLTLIDRAAFPDAEWFTAEQIRVQLSVPTAFSAYSAFFSKF